jgi:hypothetical protein
MNKWHSLLRFTGYLLLQLQLHGTWASELPTPPRGAYPPPPLEQPDFACPSITPQLLNPIRQTAPDGSVWAVRSNGKLQHSSPNGVVIGIADRFAYPIDLAIAPNNSVVAVYPFGAFHFDTKGNLIQRLGEANNATNLVRDVIVAPDESIWLTEANSVQRFNAGGQLLQRLDGDGTPTGGFGNALKLASNADGNVWVADLHNHRLLRFDVDGRLMWSSYRINLTGLLQYPVDIAVDHDNSLWVIDQAGSLFHFNPDGMYIGHLTSSQCFNR